ncbi:tail fiber assembly protein, partial [Morganella morganii]
MIPDHRGTKVYDTTTAQESEIKELGELPDGVTTIAPDVEFPKWNGKKWVSDKAAKKESDIAAAEAQKKYLIAEVTAETEMLRVKLALKRIKPDEEALLIAWLDYLDELEAVDVSTAPDIIWPEKPVV